MNGKASQLSRKFELLVTTILIAVSVSTFLVSIYAHLRIERHRLDWEWWAGFTQNLSTEVLGALLTFWLIDVGIRRLEEAQQAIIRMDEEEKQKLAEQENLKRNLIRQMGSNINADAKIAVAELRAKGWLEDGSLNGAELSGANLRGANLHRANLRKANLKDANLEHVDLTRADLEEADLANTNLRRANLIRADLTDANLYAANLPLASLWLAILKGANLTIANLYLSDLRDASLHGSNLTGANLESADITRPSFNDKTLLPDGTNYHYQVRLNRFFDATNAQFWRSTDPLSPANPENTVDQGD